MNEQLVLVAIGLVVALVVAWPLVRRRPTAPESSRSPKMAPEPSEQLAELELDRAMGRVSETDYERFRAELEDRTAIAEPGAPQPAPNDARQRAEDLVRHWKQAPRATCPTCGLRPEPEAAFCSNCGTKLEA